MKIKTKSGFECKVDENRVKDWRYVSMSARLAKEKNELALITGLDEMITFILGEEQRNEFLSFIAEKNGVADSNTVTQEFKLITEMMGEQLKKSMPSQA